MVKLVAESFDLGGKLFGNFAILFCIAFTTDRAQQFGIASNTYGCFYRKIVGAQSRSVAQFALQNISGTDSLK